MTNDVTLRGRIQGPIKRRVDCKGDLYAKFVIIADGLRGRVPCMAFGSAAKALLRMERPNATREWYASLMLKECPGSPHSNLFVNVHRWNDGNV